MMASRTKKQERNASMSVEGDIAAIVTCDKAAVVIARAVYFLLGFTYLRWEVTTL